VPVLLAPLVSLALLAAPPAAEGVAPLVRRCVDAYGGKAALATSARVREVGTVTSILHPGTIGRIGRVYARSGRLRVEIAFGPGEPEIRVLDGSRGWRDGQPVTGPRLAAMLLQAARLDLPALLDAWTAKVEDRGTLELGGRKLRVLAVEPAPGLVVEAALDPATGRILRSRGASRDPAMPLEFVTTYSDFETVQGVLVPMREENWANGKSTGVTILQDVSFPDGFPEAAFRP
jgi:hypothetical protein